MDDFNLYFSDLKEHAQNSLLTYLGLSCPEEANWDTDIFPISTFTLDDYAGLSREK